MKGVGTDIGIIHFVGIGGIGMSGIAEVMHNLGYQVQGSDLAQGASVARLRARGITVKIGHAKDNIDGVAVVVTSTAVRRTNPEVAAALEGLAFSMYVETYDIGTLFEEAGKYAKRY